MTNKIKGEVELAGPDGDSYTLVFGFEALVLVEDKRQMSFGDVVEELNGGRVGAIGALVWAALHQHHPDMTFEAAGRLVMRLLGEGRAGELQQKLVEAIGLAFPNKNAEVDTPAPRPRRAAASTSSDA